VAGVVHYALCTEAGGAGVAEEADYFGRVGGAGLGLALFLLVGLGEIFGDVVDGEV